MTRAEFEAAVERLRREGPVTIRDYPGGPDRPPFRYVTLEVFGNCGNVPEFAGRFVRAAVEAGAYMVIVAGCVPISVSVSIARNLESDEIGEFLDGRSRLVEDGGPRPGRARSRPR